MGFNVFWDDWNRLKSGDLYLTDCTRLDPEKDRLLIEYLALHGHGDFMPKFLRRYKITEEFLKTAGTEDPDEIYRTYLMIREQAMRENSRKVLKEAAFGSSHKFVRRFAFCRLTGYSWGKSEYTFACGLKSDILRGDIEAFCREMIEKDGPFADEAGEWIEKLKEIPDETLDDWAEGDTERTRYNNLHERAEMLLNPLIGEIDPDSTEFHEQIRDIFDAYIMMVYEEQYGKVTRQEKSRRMDSFTREAYEILKKMIREMIHDEAEAVVAVLSTAGIMRHEFTRDWIREIAWDNTNRNPQHGYFLGLAYKYGIETEKDEKKASLMFIYHKFDR